MRQATRANGLRDARDTVAEAWSLLEEHHPKRALPLLRKAVETLEELTKPFDPHAARKRKAAETVAQRAAERSAAMLA